MHWRNDMNNQTAFQKTLGVEDQTERSGFHNAFFHNESDVITPIQNLTNFTVMADVHCSKRACDMIRKDNGQLFVFAGDATSQGSNYETEKFMECLENKQSILALGNHDLFGNFIENTNQSYNEKVTVGDVEFYILNVHCVFGIISHKVCPNLVDEAIAFLKDQMDTHENKNIKHRFIVMHTPIYSTGYFGSYPELTPKFEEFMNQHKDKNIRAVFGGHDHIFEAF